MTNKVSERLNEIMKERDLKQVDILNKSEPYQKKHGVKLSKSHLSQYVNGKSQPDQHKLFILSETLDVNEAWLMGYDVPKEKNPINTGGQNKRSNIETIAAHIDDDVTEEELEDIKKYIDFIKSQRK